MTGIATATAPAASSSSPTTTSNTNNNNNSNGNDNDNSERLILFHSPDTSDLGVQLVHSPDDGQVRIHITSNVNQEDINSSGIIEGKLHHGDIVCEAAGVNMRHPISEHMWKLTLGLLKVAPKPIEIIITSDSDKKKEDGKKKEESFYQLQVETGGANTMDASAVLWSPEGNKNEQSVTTPAKEKENEDDNIHPGYYTLTTPNGDEIKVAIRNPFNDIGRFGPERRIIFHTQSLGVKLHRSPTEGVVHILHVTPFKPFGSDEKHPREGPNNGFLEAGDTIFEVGGIDLRNKIIGQLEWADMVHFIKHVERPLDMVIAKDKLFTRERAGVANKFDREVNELQMQVEEVQRKKKEEEEEKDKRDAEQSMEDSVEQNNMVVDTEKEKEERDDTIIVYEEVDQMENQEKESPDCFNVAVDVVCNLPCAPDSTEGSGAEEIDIRKDDSWIKKFDNDGVDKQQQSEKKAEKGKEEGEEDAAATAAIVVKANEPEKIKNHPWIKNQSADVEDRSVSSIEEVEETKQEQSPTSVPTSPVSDDGDVASTAKSKSPGSTTMSFYSRTYPTGKSSVVTSPCVAPQSSSVNADEPTGTVTEIRSVAQLKEMYSPVKNPEQVAASTNAVSSPKEDSTSDMSGEGEKKVKELFSPIVMNSPGQKEEEESVTIQTPNEKIVAGSIQPQSTPWTCDYCEVATFQDFDAAVAHEKECAAARSKKMQEEEMKDPAQLSPSTKRAQLAQSILKDKRASPVGNKMEEDPPTSPTDPTDGIKVPQLTPKPFDETNNSSFHSAFLKNLNDEFSGSPDKTLHVSESRDDDDNNHVKKQLGDTKILSKPDKSKHVLYQLSQQQQQQQEERHDLSPTGSTVSVEDKKKPSFSERSFNSMMNSPFAGNIKFSSPTTRVPASSLFAQAFVVQHQSNIDGEESINVRWVHTDSPLFVTTNKDVTGDTPNAAASKAGEASSYLQFNSPRTQPEPTTVKGFNDLNQSAFDMSELSFINDDSESDGASFELNETIVYADDTEHALDCCSPMSALCGSENMFEGLVGNCGNADSHRQEKERANKVPSPRRKNLLSRLRNKKKKVKMLGKKNVVEYGNLDNDNEEHEEMKGVRKAHVQLTRQNILGGKSIAAASQFALLIDDEMDM